MISRSNKLANPALQADCEEPRRSPLQWNVLTRLLASAELRRMPTEAANTVGRSTGIRLTRTSEWKNRFRAFTVFINGAKIGKIRNGQTITFPINPGDHELFVKIDWCESNAVVVSVPDGVTADFTCGSGFAAQRLIAAAFSGIDGAYVAVWPTGA